ncbi:MAG: hypothetical protein CMH83_17020 [Nocardioides sp.]|nr:hypothetical protein [Nocardioides sp.]
MVPALAGTTVPPYPDTVDELVDVLRADPVLVESAYGSGDAAGTEARIAAVAGQVPFDVYVAVVGTPSDVDAGSSASDFLATALARRIGEPGLYVVSAAGQPLSLRVIDTGWDETAFSLQRYRNLEAVEEAFDGAPLAPGLAAEVAVRTAVEEPVPLGAGPDEPSLSESDVDELVERQEALAPFDLPDLEDTAEPWSVGKRWMVGTLVAVGLLLLVLQTLVGWPGWSSRTSRTSRTSGTSRAAATRRTTEPRPPVPPRTPPDREAVRAEAEAAVTDLAERLESARGSTAYDDAVAAREVAGTLLHSDDVLDLVGATVLAHAGRRALRGSTPALRVCFFDPRHTGALRDLGQRWGAADVSVPACPACAAAVDRGDQPEALLEPYGRRGGRSRPYYEGTSVWAGTGFGSLSAGLGSLLRQVRRDDAARGGRR